MIYYDNDADEDERDADDGDGLIRTTQWYETDS